MEWLINLFTTTDSIAHIAILYAMVIAVGVLLGKIKFGGIALGVTFVLFAGIVAGHFGMRHLSTSLRLFRISDLSCSSL